MEIWQASVMDWLWGIGLSKRDTTEIELVRVFSDV